jgi:hypothetical protein
VVVGLLAWTPFPVGIWHDDGVYALTARALASGHGLVLHGVPGTPPAVRFPPVYPALLAPLWWLTPSVEAFSRAAEGLNLLILAMGAAVFSLYLRDGVGLKPGLSAAVALVSWLHLELWWTAFVPLSEPLFVLLLGGTLLSVARLVPGPGTAAATATATAAGTAADSGPAGPPGAGRDGRRAWLGAALLLLLLLHTRTAGVAFVLGAGMALLQRRALRTAALVGATVVAGALPWALWSRWARLRVPEPLHDLLGGYGGALRHGLFADPAAFLATLPPAALDLGRAVARVLLPGLDGRPFQALAFPVLALALAGLVRLVRERPEAGWGLVAYGCQLLLWPFRDPRLVAPVVPLLVLCFVLGVGWLLRVWVTRSAAREPGQPGRTEIGAQGRRWVEAVATVWVVAFALGAGGRIFAEGATRPHEIRTRQLDGMVDAVTRVTPPGAVVGAPELWAAVALHTGRQGVPSAAFRLGSTEGPLSGTPLEQYRIWRVTGLEYLVTEAAGRVHGSALDLIEQTCPGALTVLARWEGQAVVRIGWDRACREGLGLDG